LLRGHTIKQPSRLSPDLFTSLTVPHWKKCPWKNFKWSGNPRYKRHLANVLHPNIFHYNYRIWVLYLIT